VTAHWEIGITTIYLRLAAHAHASCLLSIQPHRSSLKAQTVSAWSQHYINCGNDMLHVQHTFLVRSRMVGSIYILCSLQKLSGSLLEINDEQQACCSLTTTVDKMNLSWLVLYWCKQLSAMDVSMHTDTIPLSFMIPGSSGSAANPDNNHKSHSKH